MSTVRQEIYFRLMFSCFLSSAVSTCLLFFLSCIVHVRISYPWRWIMDSIWDALAFGQLLAYTCNFLTVCTVTILCYQRISVADHVARKYYQLGTELLWTGIHTVLICTGLAGLNTMFVLHILAPAKYASIFSDVYFLTFNQRSHCLVSCGAFMGLVFSVTLILFNRLTLLYSHTSTTLWEIVSEHTLQRALTTVGRIIYFIPLYALCPKPFYDVHQRLPLLWLLLDIRMLILLFVVSFHLQLSWGFSMSILKWQFCKPLTTSMNTVFKTPESAYSAFSETTAPVEKNLALERLADLIATDPLARSSIFSLNTLGGRPLLWRQISGWSLEVIEKFLTNAHRANSNLLSKATVAVVPPVEMKYRDRLSPLFRLPTRQKFGVSPSSHPTSRDGLILKDTPQNFSEIVAKDQFSTTASFVLSQISKIASRLPFLPSVTADVPYAITAELFAKPPGNDPIYTGGQSLIWAIEIIACLTLASYTEDTFGSVQRSLGRILTLLADGLETMERHLHLVGLLTRDIGMNDRFQKDENESSCSFLFDDIGTSPRMTTHKFPVSGKMGEFCNMVYYPFASDPTLPWRVYATLAWATTNCLRQFGDHLESIQMSQKARQRLRSVMAARLGSDQLSGSAMLHN